MRYIWSSNGPLAALGWTMFVVELIFQSSQECFPFQVLAVDEDADRARLRPDLLSGNQPPSGHNYYLWSVHYWKEGKLDIPNGRRVGTYAGFRHLGLSNSREPFIPTKRLTYGHNKSSNRQRVAVCSAHINQLKWNFSIDVGPFSSQRPCCCTVRNNVVLFKMVRTLLGIEVADLDCRIHTVGIHKEFLRR